jgi:putative peptidoglycan lipid II flippase
MLTSVRERNVPAAVASREVHLRIFAGLARAMTFILFAKAIGAAKEIVVAAIYGTTAPVNAYLLVFKLYDLPITVWAGALGVTFVPMFFGLRDVSDEFARFRRELSGAVIVGGTALGLVAAVVTPVLLGLQSFDVSEDVKEMAIEMARPMALMIPLGGVMAVVFNRLVAGERHIASLLDGAPALVLLATLVLMPSGGSAPLIWGTVGGYAVAAALLIWAQARLEPFHFPIFRFRSSLWRHFARSSVVVVAAGFVLGVTGVIDQFMVAHLDPAAIATLGYATRILALIIGIGATAITRAILPILSDAETESGAHAWRVASKWSAAFMVLGALAAIVGWFLAPFVVQLMFERGAFTAADTAAVAEVLRYGLLQLPFCFSSVIMAQLWAARGRYGVFLTVNTVGLIVKLAANAVLIERFGINGAMIATALMYASCLLVLWAFAINRGADRTATAGRQPVE